jgi:ribonucleoside-diphosphate reductase alpha chain
VISVWKPLTKFLCKKKFIYEQDKDNPNTIIFSFPINAPSNSIITTEVTALSQLNLWKIYQEFWCEHKPSITVFYKSEEFIKILDWIWDNFNSVSGIAFLPLFDHIYPQAPYENITEDEYKLLVKKTPKAINWKELNDFEKEDTTASLYELSCTGNSCEL